MKKRLFSLVLALALCVGLMVPASAVSAVSSQEDKTTVENWPKSGQPETGLSLYTEVKTIMSTHGPWVPGIPAGTKRPVAFTCYGLKDSSGNIVLPADYYSLKYLGPDRLLAGAIELTEDGYAVIDLHGNIVIPFGKYEIKPVELDRAGARVFLGSTAIWSEEYDSSSIHAAMYDWNGNAIFKYEDCQGITYVEDGFFILTANDGKKGIYEYGVGMTLPLGSSYKFITHYIYKNYNLFGVMNQDGLCGVIDKNGNKILPCAYEYVGAYRNGCFIISRFMRESSRDYYRQNNSLTQPDRDNMEDALVSAHGNELIPFGRYDSIVFSGDYVQGGTWTGRYKGSLTPDVDKIYHYSDSFQISDLLAGKGGTAPVEPLSPIKPSTGTTSSTEMPSVSVQFKDVCGSDYYADAVLWAVEKNITSGTSATTFSPGTTCSKAQILTFLWRANGSPEPTAANPFTDIKPADYFYKAALWAAEKGLVSGSTFGAITDCTRAMTVEYLWKAAGSPTPSANASFTDVSANAEYAQAVAWAVENKITSGTGGGNFSPNATCTRGQIVTFLYRAMGK